MRKILLFTITLLSLFFSCSSDEEDFPHFDGEWNMKSYVAFMPSVPVLETNDVIWDFDTPNKILTVHNTVEAEYPYLLKTGNYDYKFEGGQIAIKRNTDFTYYNFDLSEKNLTLDSNTDPNISNDGPVIRFERIE